MILNEAMPNIVVHAFIYILKIGIYLHIKNMKATNMIQQEVRPFSVESNTLNLYEKLYIINYGIFKKQNLPVLVSSP